ncbi:hypothetical protein BKA80DRAFT_276036 [Phyllosticta citrichinensis]
MECPVCNSRYRRERRDRLSEMLVRTATKMSIDEPRRSRNSSNRHAIHHPALFPSHPALLRVPLLPIAHPPLSPRVNSLVVPFCAASVSTRTDGAAAGGRKANATSAVSSPTSVVRQPTRRQSKRASSPPLLTLLLLARYGYGAVGALQTENTTTRSRLRLMPSHRPAQHRQPVCVCR